MAKKQSGLLSEALTPPKRLRRPDAGRLLRRKGLTLTDLLTTMVIIVLMTAFSLPAINALMNSFGSAGSAEAMINAALSNARAIAIKEHRYAGIRFQLAYDPCDSNPFNADQYMIFIVLEEPANMSNLTIGFRAVEGMKPIKLPENFNVMDLFVRTNTATSQAAAEDIVSSDVTANELTDSSISLTLPDLSSCSIIFSPSGQLVVHQVRTRNRGGDYRPVTPQDSGYDEIFNSPVNVQSGYGRFVQDDYANLGLGAEYSRNHFVIYDKKKFERLDEAGRFTYINNITKLYISPYAGKIISTD